MSYAAEVLADSPTAYWRLGEPSGTTATDAVGAHNGTYVNVPTFGVAGPLDDGDTAVTFNGTDEYVDTTTLGTLGGNTLTSSWEFWVKTTTTATVRAILGTISTGTSNIIQIHANTTLVEAASVGNTFFSHRGSNSQIMDASIATNIYDGAWHHVVWVIESASLFSVYVDGTSVTVTNGNLLGPGGAGNFTHSLCLGARNIRGVIDHHFAGSLDEVAVYPTRLTSTRVQAHYDARITPVADGTMKPGTPAMFHPLLI